MKNKIIALKEILQKSKLDYFILPNNDEFNNEYLPESAKRIEFITKFNGSNAIVIFGSKKSYFFTDGRYLLQAKNQLDLKEFEILDLAQISILKWLSNNVKANQKIAIDPKLHSVSQVRVIKNHIEAKGSNLVVLKDNLIDQIWQNKPESPKTPVFILDQKFSGDSAKNKISKLTDKIEENADALFLNFAPSINWLLNIRGSDVDYSPLALCYALIYKDCQIDLFIESSRLSKEVKIFFKKNKINIVEPSDIEKHFKLRAKNLKNIQIDPTIMNFFSYEILSKNKFNIIEKTDPILALKAIKNKVEIANNIKAHEKDGLALTRFLFWLEKNQNIDEISAAKKLLEFRQIDKDFFYPSFETISSFGSNGAIIHYRVDEKSNKKFGKNNLYLLDSGGQYFQGTTDVTRTILIGNAKKEHIANFTRVLKGHIAIARTKFPQGTSGESLDILARYHLWQDFKDYAHGTGHGVGQFLSVHEFPPSISKRNNNTILEEGMILSNEPGYYENGKYGIRIENLMLVVKSKNKDFLQFKTLTLAPIDPRLIDFKMLTYPEKKWLYEYHLEIFKKFAKKLSKEEKLWLQEFAQIRV